VPHGRTVDRGSGFGNGRRKTGRLISNSPSAGDLADDEKWFHARCHRIRQQHVG
jgi:hypothetical protein